MCLQLIDFCTYTVYSKRKGDYSTHNIQTMQIFASLDRKYDVKAKHWFIDPILYNMFFSDY